MNLWMTDSQFNTVGLIIIAVITIAPSMLAAYWANKAKSNSQHARDSAASAAHQVMNNGGMSDPDPNLNDHIKYQTQMLEALGQTVETLGGSLVDVDGRLTEHLDHSVVMDTALAEVYLLLKNEGLERKENENQS